MEGERSWGCIPLVSLLLGCELVVTVLYSLRLELCLGALSRALFFFPNYSLLLYLQI